MSSTNALSRKDSLSVASSELSSHQEVNFYKKHLSIESSGMAVGQKVQVKILKDTKEESGYVTDSGLTDPKLLEYKV